LAFAGEHFILRDAAERWTLAGGTVLLPDADRRKPHAPDHVRWLQRLSDAFAGPAAWIRTMLARRGWMSISEGNRTTFGAVELETAAAALVTAGEVHDAGAWLVARDAWERLLAASREAIVKFHAASPEKPGLPLTELRSVLATVPDEVFQAMLAGLERDAHVRQGSVIRSRAHRLELPPQLREAGDRIRRTLSEKPMEPPGRKELAPDAGAQTALRFLIQNGEAVDLGPELVLGTRAFNEAVAAVKSHLQQHGGATVSELRPVLGTTRRILIPLLEQLDRQRITLRQGDRRVLPG
ncbi:MAG TPA: hypothetical protein DCY13_09740, partial [Verrucomicrobiales bacterium]|nr:hypothetical protein [Verrucomicrobiales bacterium]